MTSNRTEVNHIRGTRQLTLKVVYNTAFQWNYISYKCDKHSISTACGVTLVENTYKFCCKELCVFLVFYAMAYETFRVQSGVMRPYMGNQTVEIWVQRPTENPWNLEGGYLRCVQIPWKGEGRKARSYPGGCSNFDCCDCLGWFKLASYK